MTAVAQRSRRDEAESGDDAPGRCPVSAQPADLLARLVADRNDSTWSLRTDDAWAYADHDRATALPRQGWKLHVAATEATVLDVLQACAPVLFETGCTFKAARTIADVRRLTGPHCPRGNAGKVLTAYPASADEAVRVAHLLDAATEGLAGPRILSDRALRDGSLVHYRYGVFTGTPTLTHDGELTLSLVTPDGRLVPDVRTGTFTPPAWAPDPFLAPVAPPASPNQAAPTPTAPPRVLLGDRFAVREAIRHANRGGVFRAEDVQTGEPVIVKQARAHVAADAHGRDVRDRLRHEWSILEALAGTGLLPRPIHLFEQGGDLFLAESDLRAQTLRTWAAAGGEPRAAAHSLEVLANVAEALRVVHAGGFVLRDLSPNNVLVRDDRSVAIIDPELAIPAGATADPARGGGTAAYAPPEQLTGAEPSLTMDLHALGAVILFTLTGEDPLLGVDGSATIEAWLDRGSRRACLPGDLAGLAGRLCAEPAARPSLSEAIGALRRTAGSVTRTGWHVPGEPERARLALTAVEPIDDNVLEDAIDTLTDRLVREVEATSAGPRHGGRLMRASSFGETTLPTNVQHGAAGVLGVLVQAARLLDETHPRAAVSVLADWIEAAPTPSGGPVGLHFGHAGPAWALAEAAALLGDRARLDRSVERVLALPTSFRGPDVTHGLAGLGLTLVRLWELTGDGRLRARIAEVATRLATQASRDEHGVSWRTPVDAPTTFAGTRYHGYAHGTAGIGTFLRYAAELLADERLLALSVECADSLVAAALELSDGRLVWGSGPEEPAPVLQHWCNGSSGVATFLVRMAGDLTGGRSGGEQVEQVLAGAGRAIVAAKWQSGIAYCHGLSGNADALLDIASILGDDRYREQAADLLRIMWDRRQTDAFGVGLSDEPGRVTADFGVGSAGALSALLRLRHGGPRLWMPEGRR